MKIRFAVGRRAMQDIVMRRDVALRAGDSVESAVENVAHVALHFNVDEMVERCKKGNVDINDGFIIIEAELRQHHTVGGEENNALGRKE